MRPDLDILLRLAESRRRRLVNGRPVFALTDHDAEGSARSAMRLAQASKSQVADRAGERCLAA
jgi:hypothetical protein